VDNVAEIASILPGYTPERFHDNTIVELPGLFESPREASVVYTQLVASGTITGYEEYFVIAALMSPPINIQSRRPIASIEDLKGLAVRINDTTEAAVFEELGMRPVPMAINLTLEAISNGELGSATVPAAVFENARLSCAGFRDAVGLYGRAPDRRSGQKTHRPLVNVVSGSLRTRLPQRPLNTV
jgi:TRAP-type C4-dicarboxylate transport system substrate-binding protein